MRMDRAHDLTVLSQAKLRDISRQHKLNVWPKLGRYLLIDVALLVFC